MSAYDENETKISTCCSKRISIEEAVLNHGMCNECMDKACEIPLRDE